VPLIVAYGAALTSLGLAVATWVPRLGRAVACTVIAYVLVAVGWPFAVLAFLNGDDVLGPGLASASPFFGAGMVSARLERNMGDHLDTVGYWAIFWTIAYLVAAAVLYFLTLVTFNQNLGRTTSGQERVMPVAPPRSPALRHLAGTVPPLATDGKTAADAT
jgi:hypothetical protein